MTDIAPAAPAAPATPPPAAPAVAAAPTQTWTDGFSDDLKGYVQNKGFQNPGELLESYRNFEKLQGVPQNQILKLPQNLDISTPEGRAVFERLGAPKDAKEYKIDLPKEGGDQQAADWLRDYAHKNALTHKQVENLVQGWNELQTGRNSAMTEAQAMELKNQNDGLKKEWGAAFDQNINVAKAAARVMGLEAKQVDALEASLGFSETMKLLHKFGSATGEHSFVSGAPANAGLLSRDQAMSKISELSSDRSFGARLSRGEAEAKRQWDNLHKMAYYE
jgi:hypothetical protein